MSGFTVEVQMGLGADEYQQRKLWEVCHALNFEAERRHVSFLVVPAASSSAC